MMKHMRQRLSTMALFVLMTLAATPLAARADEEPKIYDGRIQGYDGKTVQLDNGGSALTYFLFVVLGGLGVGVMFKNANRTHLD